MLDDLHWADSASLELLSYIVRHHAQARLLVLGTCRESEIGRNPTLERAVNEQIRQRVLDTVVVNPLTAEEVEALAVSYLGGPTGSNVGPILYEQSEGNPFFAEELLRNWLEAGAIAQGDNGWMAVVPLKPSLPPSIVGALRQRFARLPSEIIGLLRIAAIIGRTFDLSLLSTVAGQEIEMAEECLLEAASAGLIRTDLKGAFSFSHDKIRECLYAEVSSSRCRRLHDDIGRELEARYNQESPKRSHQLAELAFHFTRSRDRARGATYSELAAEQALRSSATNAARDHYRAALEQLDPHDGRRGRLLLGLGEAALLVGAEDEAAVAYESALTWLSEYGELEAAARAAHGLGMAHWWQGALQAARARLEHALELLGDAPCPETVRVLVDLSTLLTLYLVEPEEGCARAQQAIEMARQLGDGSLEAAASRADAGKRYVSGGGLTSALQSLKLALALAEESDDLSEAAECSFHIAGAYYWRAEMRHSYQASLRGIQLLERCHKSNRLPDAYFWLALLFASQGAWSKAEQALEQAQLDTRQQSHRDPSSFQSQIRGFLAYQREEYATAEREFEAAVAKQGEGHPGSMFIPGLLALAQVGSGKRGEAYSHRTELEAFLAKLPPGSLPSAPILTCLALLAIALGDRERAAALYPRLRAFVGQHYRFLVDRVLGEMATLCGDHDAAMMHLSAAEATARREGLRPELARTLVAQALCEGASGGQGSATRATTLLKQGLAVFEELNMPRSVGHLRHQIHTLSRRSHRSNPQSLPADLTQSEVRVLRKITEGKSNGQIARELGLSEKTVANHLTHIFNKTASPNRAAAATFAIRHGLA
jgi:DNA-binding CsgD family transcriptional regulator/tetratricopeptide (TPR) repeat protein